MNAALQSPRMIRVGLIDGIRYSLIGILLFLSGIWEASVAIVKWTLFVVLCTVIVTVGMVALLILLICGGPMGVGFLIAMAIFAILWCLEEVG
jgi:hypothetical protein